MEGERGGGKGSGKLYSNKKGKTNKQTKKNQNWFCYRLVGAQGQII